MVDGERRRGYETFPRRRKGRRRDKEATQTSFQGRPNIQTSNPSGGIVSPGGKLRNLLGNVGAVISPRLWVGGWNEPDFKLKGFHSGFRLPRIVSDIYHYALFPAWAPGENAFLWKNVYAEKDLSIFCFWRRLVTFETPLTIFNPRVLYSYFYYIYFVHVYFPTLITSSVVILFIFYLSRSFCT